MNLKTIKTMPILFILAIITLTAFKCENEDEPANSSLQGTTWKLEGIVNEQTNSMQVLAPVDCDRCYMFTFDSDSTASGEACPNVLMVHLGNIPSLGIVTYINHLGDEKLFTEATQLVDDYEYDGSKSKLKFFYQKDNVNYYLLFKKIDR